MITPYELWTKRKPNLNYLRVWGCRAVVRLPDRKLKTLGERGIEYIFVGYVKHSKAFMFFVIKSNESVSINSIIESKDAIFDGNKFFSIPRPSLRIPNGTEDTSGSMVLEEFTKEVVTQKTNPELIKRTRDYVSDQHSYCFNVDNDPKIFDEAMKSQDVAFWKEAINDEMNFIMGNNTWVLPDLPPCCKPLGCKWIFKRKLKVDETLEKFKARLVIQGFRQKSEIDYFNTCAPVARISTIRLLIALALIHSLIIHQMDVKITFLNGELDEEEFLSSRFSMKDMGEANVIMVSTPMDTSEKPIPNNRHAVSQLEYSKVIGSLMYAMTCNRPDIAFAVGKLSRYTSHPGTQHWQAIQRIINAKDNSSSKKQTYITRSKMEFEFVALAAAGKEVEWLRNLILEIPLWYKPIASISIRCDRDATLAKAYSQMYNGKSRHLGVKEYDS
ncbi:zinc finger, CCHC-type containing protein [Tanacetum coccineum]